MIKILFLSALTAISLAASGSDRGAVVATEKPAEFNGIGITENLGAQLDLDLQVRDESGELLPLKTYINGTRPVLLSLVYYSCPGLCNFHLNGLTEALKKLDWSVGKKFDVIALSFDPKEGPDLANKKKESYLKLYGRAGTEAGWHFLTADDSTIKPLTQSVGFKYKWDEAHKDWAHASAAIVLTPEGKVSRYLNGIIFEPKDIKLALMDAVKGKVGNIAERLVWYCYHYDPQQSKYTIIAFRIVQLGGAIFVLLMAFFFIPFWLRARKGKRQKRA